MVLQDSVMHKSVVALSTTKAEYIALAEAFKEALYLSKLMKELDGEVPEDGIIVFEDNTACGQWANGRGEAGAGLVGWCLQCRATSCSSAISSR